MVWILKNFNFFFLGMMIKQKKEEFLLKTFFKLLSLLKFHLKMLFFLEMISIHLKVFILKIMHF